MSGQLRLAGAEAVPHVATTDPAEVTAHKLLAARVSHRSESLSVGLFFLKYRAHFEAGMRSDVFVDRVGRDLGLGADQRQSKDTCVLQAMEIYKQLVAARVLRQHPLPTEPPPANGVWMLIADDQTNARAVAQAMETGVQTP